MAKNKKKTAREKRLLVGSFLIAAVIAAGSTFAWFTSSDTVTNRLSANADYNVSVIETFTPPANWIPGQKVNKDTSAINTGNIEAFVKQKLEGVMQVTLEYADKSEFDLTGDKTYVELTEDEVDVIEAGGFLAYAKGDEVIGVEKGEPATPTQCYLGEISAVHSGKHLEAGDFGSDVQFTPPATGDYIFRRVINVDPATDTTDMSNVTEKYKYVGYHYDADTGKYYKIKNLNGLQPKEDGILVAAPTVYYAIEKQEKKTLPLRFEASLTRNYISYTSDGSTVKKEYTAKETVTEPGVSGPDVTYTKYTLVEGGDIFVDEDNKVYNSITPAANEIGTDASATQETTPTRLVATYTVDKSEDVFIDADVNPDADNRTDLSNPTATEYDNELTAIAKSDYLIEKAAYDTAYNQYILNKNAYDAGVALLTAIAQNEDKLNAMMGAISGVNTTKTISALALNNGAAPPADVFTTEVTAVNTALGSTGVAVGDIATVDDLKTVVDTYAALPNETNWQAVVTAYNSVENAFTSANRAIDALERAIVNAWNDAKPTELATAYTLADVATITAANVSPEANAAKAAAAQLIAWEATLQTYQNDIAAYYAKLVGIHADSQYKLQPVTDLEKAYEAAAGARADSYSTDATFDTNDPDVQTGRATVITPNPDALSVQADYLINADLPSLHLNAGKGAPIENAISEDGYAGTEIANITGAVQFTINGIAVGSNPTAPGAPAKGAYTDATNNYNKYQTTQTNQAANNDIVIYINLNNLGDGSETDKWKLTPTLNPGDKTANFYYTSILGAGETTSILVDSVELSGDTTNVAYKNFDFDLNVTVDSAQVVVSEDGNYYLPTAVSANTNFVAKPTKSQYDKASGTPVNTNGETGPVDWN